MPVSVFSPLARGFGTWTGELHLAENDKGPGPSLPSLLPEDPYCQHSGVTVKPRAKSAVSAFSARSAATSRPQTAWNEKPDGELVLPKTYLTKKGAIVLYAAPDDTQNIELSERDRLYLKKARKKLLKHRYVEYSNKIGSINRLTQSVLAFGDEDYNKETDSVSDSDKVWLKFTRDENDKEVVDKHSRPGGNIDMYLNDLMSRSGPRPSPPIIDWRSSVDLGPRPESVADSVDSSQGDLLLADSEYPMKYTSPQPPSLTPTRGGMDMGRASPSARPKKLSADKLAASLKSSGFLGRQTIIEEDELRSQSKSGSRSRSRTSGSVNSRRKSRGSSGIGARTNTPEVSEVAGSGVEEHLYLSEDAEEESDWEDGETFTQPLMPSYNAVLDISLLSGGSGKGTFSFEATTVDSPEAQDYVNDPVTRALSKQGSVRSERLASTSSNVSHVTGSRPQSTADRTSPSRPQSMADRTSLSRPQSSASILIEEQHPESSAHSDISAEQERMNSAKRSKEGSLERELSERSAAETVQDFKDQSQAVDDIAAAAERPESAASSHSGVPSEAVEVAVIDDVQPEDTEQQNESRREVEQTLADITTPKPPSSYASSVSSQELLPEPAVTEVRITPLSSAMSGQRTTPSPLQQQQQKDTAVSQQPQTSHTTVIPQKTAESTAAAEKPPSKPPAAVEKSKPATTAAKPVPSTTSAASKTAEEKTKTSAPPATHMTQAKKPPPKEQPKQTLKEQPKQPSKEQPKQLDQSKATAKSTKEDTKKAVIEDKKIKEEKKVKVEPIKKPEKQKAEKKEKEAKAEKDKKKAAEKTEAPKKEFTKVFDITNYDAPEKKKEEVEPVTKEPPKESQPKSLVSDTKAEIARLFGTPPVKKESAREKKERLKREVGPRTPRLKKPVEEKPPKPSKEEKELEQLEKQVMEAIGDGTSAIPVDDETGGLTVEEMELEQELLKQKLNAAEAKLQGKEPTKQAAAGKKSPREGKGKKGKKKQADSEDLQQKREALKEAKRLEKQKRLEEAKKMEEELRKKEAEKKQALEKAKTETMYVNEDIADLKRQAEEAERAEEEARLLLQEERKRAREEREKRRKEEQERKKNDALQKREQERNRIEAARQREQEMLLKLATQEDRRRIMEENRQRREQEEEKAMMDEQEAQKLKMEEERLARLKMEEDEARIAELERQEEEKALARLTEERDDALRKKRQMEEIQRKLAEEEEQKRKEYEAEQKRIEDNRLKREEEEKQRREQEKQRLVELQRIEEEAREKMKLEMQRRREALMRRRDQNLERRANLDGLKQKQGMTKGWVFSYYVHWPRETYEMRMGGADDKKKRAKTAPAKTRPTHT